MERWEVWWRPTNGRWELFSDVPTSFAEAKQIRDGWHRLVGGEWSIRRKVVPLS